MYFAISDLTAIPQKGSVLSSNVLKNMGPVQHPNVYVIVMSYNVQSSGLFSRLFKRDKKSNKMILPDDSKPAIIWDEKLG